MDTYQQIKETKKYIFEDQYNNVFTSDHVISDSGFVDFLFIGTHKGQPVVWNACMTTTKGDYYDRVSDAAYNAAYEMYPSSRKDDDWDDMFIDLEEEHETYGKLYQYVDRDPERTENMLKATATFMMAALDRPTITIKNWDIEIDEEYQYGVGLHIRADIDFINVDNIYDFIERFQERGLDAFDDKDIKEVSYTANELGVELNEAGTFVIWKDGMSRDTAAIDI